MNQQRLLLEYSAGWILVCLALGFLYAWVLYADKNPWSKRVNDLLMALRALVVAVLAFLLLGPLLKLIRNEEEKPVWVLVVDDSQSVLTGGATTDEVRTQVASMSRVLAAGDYLTEMRTLSGRDSLSFTHIQSDLAGAFRKVQNDFEGRNLAGMVLLSDGLYNSGSSPLYLDYRVPVYTVGLGDTTVRPDLAIRQVAYNKVVYQGNRFPVRVEVLATRAPKTSLMLRLRKGAQLMASREISLSSGNLVVVDFEVEAREKGLQRLEVEVDPLPDERNLRNNRNTLFFEVADAKKRVVLVAPAPHPDIKALESVLEAQPHYEWQVHIPEVKPAPPGWDKGTIDLLILHQALDPKMVAWLQQWKKSPGGMWLITGHETNVRAFPTQGLPLVFENSSQRDEVTPLLNTAFRDFAFGENAGSLIARFPPVSVPFGKFSFPSEANVLLYQRIGSVATNRPLLLTWNENDAKRALLLAEGIWRWRMSEFRETEKAEAFQELTGKLIQYLSTREDRSRFRCFPIRPAFSGAEPVVFESQLYNELLEQIFGNQVQLEITGEDQAVRRYTYSTSAGNTRYRIGTLPQGVYKFNATTSWNAVTERISGEFIVNAQTPESVQTTADFQFLRQLSEKTGGRFYTLRDADSVARAITQTPAQRVIRSDETFQSMLNLKWVFFVLLLLISGEWFVRKYLGRY